MTGSYAEVMRDRCKLCGDTKPLTAAGVCRYRGGCEHRRMVHEATVARLLARMTAQENLQAAMVPRELWPWFLD